MNYLDVNKTGNRFSNIRCRHVTNHYATKRGGVDAKLSFQMSRVVRLYAKDNKRNRLSGVKS